MRRVFPFALYWTAILLAAGLSSSRPELNWDGIAYVALALQKDGAPPRESHRLAYHHLERIAPPERLQELVASNPYRERMRGDPSAFEDNLGYYRMRQGYVGLLAGMHRFLGVNPYSASVGVGVAAYFLLAWILWAWTGRHPVQGGLGRLLPLLGLLHPGTLEAIRLTTPDLLAASLAVAGAHSLLERKERWTAAFLFLLAILCRPDILILACPILLVPAVSAWRREGAIASALPSAALFLAGVGVVAGSGAHPWTKVFHHTFVEHLYSPSRAAIAVGVSDYLEVVGTAILFLGSGKAVRILFFLAAVTTIYLCWHPLVGRERKAAAGGVLLAWLAFFFLFPLPLERFYLAHVSLVGAILFRTLIEWSAQAKEGPEPWMARFFSLLRGKGDPSPGSLPAASG